MKTRVALGALLFLFVLPIHAADTKCRYCNSSSYGYCGVAPSKKHQHNTDSSACEYCGSGSYGYCGTSPEGKHRHGSGAGKCRYCGSTSTGYCGTNPAGVHEK